MSRRPGGRPTIEPGTPSTAVSVRLPATLHDRAIKAAESQGIDLAAFLRRAVERELASFVSQNSTVIRKGRY